MFSANRPRMIVKLNDDFIVNMTMLDEHLTKYSYENHIGCKVERRAPANRNSDQKWFVSRTEYSPNLFPNYCLGEIYIMSDKSAFKLLNTFLKTYSDNYLWIEDAYITGRVTRGRYNPILSPSNRVVEQQLLIPGFLPEFLETSGDQENLRFLEKFTTGNRTRECWMKVGYLPTIPQQLHDN